MRVFVWCVIVFLHAGVAMAQGKAWDSSEIKEKWSIDGCTMIHEMKNTIVTGEYCGNNYSMHANPRTKERVNFTTKWDITKIDRLDGKSGIICENERCGIEKAVFLPSNEVCESRTAARDFSKELPTWIRGSFSEIKAKCIGQERSRNEREESKRQAYENSSAGRAEARRAQQARQMCEAQKATCIASCPLDRVYTTLPDSLCKSRCESVSCN